MSGTEIASVVGVVGAVLVAWWQLRKVEISYPSRRVRDGVSVVEAAGELLDDYRTEVQLLRTDVDKLRREAQEERLRVAALEAQQREWKQQLAEWERGIDILVRQVIGLGHEPAWRPRDTGGR